MRPSRFIVGWLAGLTATVPMSVAMAGMQQKLPLWERYALPPKLVTIRLLHRFGLFKQMKKSERNTLSLIDHFGFGALMGGLYAALAAKIPLHPTLKGPLFGLAVWFGSYMGVLPALGILRPASQNPWRRSLLMIVAHLIWGLTLGLLTDWWQGQKQKEAETEKETEKEA
ncbi:MAG TPA: DUF6789 family protein [Chloroflexia bacterium]|nr:DUF6789 family protein [Chloroflexia bacterium]